MDFLRLISVLGLLVLVGCGAKEELGMKAEITSIPAPAIPEGELLEHVVEEFTLALADAESLALFSENLPEKLPAGRLTFTTLKITNRRQDHPSRGSVIIEGEVHWQEADGDSSGTSITIKSHSMPLEQPDTETPWMRKQAAKGMWRRLLKAI